MFRFVKTEGVVENVSVNGHFIPPLPKESVEMLPAPLPPPPPPPPLPPSSSETFQTAVEDSDSQSQELSSIDSTVRPYI